MDYFEVALYANDIAMYFLNADTAYVRANINSDLTLLSRWAASNGCRINVPKCQFMVLARGHQRSRVT